MELSYESTIQSALGNFSAGKYDSIELTLGTFINLSASDPDIQTVMVASETVGADVVVAQAEIKTIEDLKGKNVGVTLGAGSEVFIMEMLKTANLTRDDVTVMKVEPPLIAQSLKDNVIQAGHTWEPYLSDALQAGGNILFSSEKTPGLILDIMIFRGEVIRSRPEDIRGFIQGWMQGLTYWEVNEEESRSIISQALNISSESISLDGINMIDLEENKKFFDGDFPYSLYQTGKIYLDFFIKAGNITRFPELNNLFNSSFINSQ